MDNQDVGNGPPRWVIVAVIALLFLGAVWYAVSK